MRSFSAVCALALFLPLALARTRPQEPEEEHETELSRHMESIEDALRSLRRSLKDPTATEAALAALVEIERETVLAKSLTPAAAEKLPEREREAFALAYRLTMLEFLAHQLALERALLEGDQEAIPAAFERLRAMEDSSHERFAPEDD